MQRLPGTLNDVRDGERGLPINLATALRLSNGRPLVIQAAQASEAAAAAELTRARALWLPDINLGAGYLNHVGGVQASSGGYFDNDRNQYLLGYGALGIVSTTDAIFMPLAARQVVAARDYDVQSARNDAMLQVAVAYFNVQQARGLMAGAADAVEKARLLVKTVTALSEGLVPPIEINRARADLAAREQSYLRAREAWGVASAELTRVLRLDPSALAVPLEPPHMQVTFISPAETVDSLIPIGLTTRPELASQRQLVQATLLRLRQERLRPLLPSLVLQGAPVPTAPGGYLMGGLFGSSNNGLGSPNQFRNDVEMQMLWGVQNMGFGNAGLIRERSAQQRQQLLEMFRVQDDVAAEIAKAHAELISAAQRIPEAETGVRQAQISFEGNIKGVKETIRFQDILQMMIRPAEVVLSIEQLALAYQNYYQAVNDYNRAEFRMYHAVGYPASILAFDRSGGLGRPQPIDVSRPEPLPPIYGGGQYEQSYR